jgi:hypothetical protein
VDLVSWRLACDVQYPESVKVFVDFVTATGLYEAAYEASWVDLGTPTRVLTAPGFLRASGFEVLAAKRRIYHVEAGEFLAPVSFGDTDVDDGDTLVVVNSDDPLFDDERSVEALWHVTGGSDRKLRDTVAAPASTRYAS